MLTQFFKVLVMKKTSSALLIYLSLGFTSFILDAQEITIDLCDGDCVTLGEPLPEAYCYAWQSTTYNIPNGYVQDAQLEICPEEDEVLILTLIDEEGNITQTVIYQIKVSSPIVEINPNPGGVCPIDGFPEELVIEEDFASSIWSTGDTNVSSVSINTPGIYSVTITNDSGCIATGSTVVLDLNESPENIEDYLVGNGFYCVG